MTKEYAIAQLHRLYRSDPWVEAVFQAAGFPADVVAELILGIYQSNWFDVMPEEYVRRYEAAMGLATGGPKTLEDRRAAIEAHWKSSGSITLAMLQGVADSWKNGEVRLSFTGGKIHATFVGSYGVPADLDGLKKALEEAKPAHLALVYAFRYLLIREIHGVKTLAEMDATPLNQFAGGAQYGEQYAESRLV